MERLTGFYGQNIEKEPVVEASPNPTRLAFVVPSFNHPLDTQINQITDLFSGYRKDIIIVNDGSAIPIVEDLDTDTILVTHDQNLGLARSLIDGYRKSLETGADLIVRADADGEYPISSIPDAIQILSDARNVGVFVEHRRSAKSSGLVDATFHNVMGYVEGKLLIGQPLRQHSPGLQVYRRSVIEKMIPVLEKYVLENDMRWGLDLLTLKLASQMGKVVSITLDSHIWYERRPVKKIVSQFVGATKIILADKAGKI